MNARDKQESAVVALRWDQPRRYNGRLTGYSVEICAVNPDSTMEQRGNCRVRLLLEFFTIPSNMWKIRAFLGNISEKRNQRNVS